MEVVAYEQERHTPRGGYPFEFLSEKIDGRIASGATVTEAVDAVLAEYRQDTASLARTSRIGWIMLKNASTSAERYGGSVEGVDEIDKQVGRPVRSGRSATPGGWKSGIYAATALTVKYVGADGALKPLAEFFLPDWQKFLGREEAIHETAGAKIEAARVAIRLLSKQPELRTDQLPEKSLRDVNAAVENFRRLEQA